ncbi:unnamed protein product [Bathycoccus prasinos]
MNKEVVKKKEKIQSLSREATIARHEHVNSRKSIYMREHISNKQAEITKVCDDISAAKAAMLDGPLAKEEGLKQIIANAGIISTSETSVCEEFHAVTKATESEPKGQTQAPSSPSDTDNN